MGVKNVKRSGAIGGGNTRVGSKWQDIGVPRGIIFVDPNATYTTTSISAFLAQFLPDLLNDDPNARAYPIQNIVEIKDSSTKPNVQTFPGDGSQIIAGENAYTKSYRWVDGGMDLLATLRLSKGQKKSFMIIDSLGNLICTDAGLDLCKGIVGYNYTNPVEDATTNAAISNYETMLSYRPEQVNENRVILDFNEDGGLGYLTSLQGLFNVDISQAAAPSSTTVTVKAVVIGMGSQDMYDLYADALAVAGAWKVRNQANNGVIVVASVAKSATLGAWVLTLTAATGLTAGVSLVGPTELAALGSPVLGYESDVLIQVIP